MELKKYIKTIFKPSVAKRAKAMKRAKRDRGKSAERARTQSFASLEKSLGYKFRDESVLREALTHPCSVGFEKKVRSNQRLEFLGDAVMEAIVSDFLFIEYPGKDEGFLTQLRSKIVSRQTLNALAVRIGLDQHVIAQGGVGFNQKHLYGDALEAMIGAIYLDKGYDYVNRLLINEILRRHINLSNITHTETDFKSRLIEWSQKNKYELEFDTRPSDRYTSQKPRFRSAVRLNGHLLGEGEGDSKKVAEQAAAHRSFELLQQGTDDFPPETVSIEL